MSRTPKKSPPERPPKRAPKKRPNIAPKALPRGSSQLAQHCLGNYPRLALLAYHVVSCLNMYHMSLRLLLCMLRPQCLSGLLSLRLEAFRLLSAAQPALPANRFDSLRRWLPCLPRGSPSWCRLVTSLLQLGAKSRSWEARLGSKASRARTRVLVRMIVLHS